MRLQRLHLRKKAERVGRGLYRYSVQKAKEKEKGIKKEEGRESEIGIGAFGMYWDRAKVDWRKKKPKLYGAQPKAEKIDFYNQSGIYILYRDYKVVYVGKADTLGQRLKQHTTGRISGRWDKFSWFGLKYVDEKGELKDIDAKNIDLSSMLEAILIECMEPPLNRRRGDNLEPQEYFQVDEIKEDRIKEEAIKMIKGALGG